MTLFLAAVHVVFLTSLFMLLFHCKALGVFTCGLECVVLWFCSCLQPGGGSTGLPPVITALMYRYYDCRCSRYFIVAGLADGSRVLFPHVGIIWIALVYVYDGKVHVHVRVCVCPCAGDRGRFRKVWAVSWVGANHFALSLRWTEGHSDLINGGIIIIIATDAYLALAFLLVSVSRAHTCCVPNRILTRGDISDIVGLDFGRYS